MQTTLYINNKRFTEKEHTVFYKGIDVGSRRADFVVEWQEVIE